MLKSKLSSLKRIIINLDKNYFFLFIIVLIISAPLISKNYLLGHDTLYHISNIDAITEMLREFNFTKITPVIADGFGYGGSIFYPKLPHYFTAVINLFVGHFNVSVIYSLKISHIIASFLSAIFMYKLLNLLFKNKQISLLGSVFYITMPYFLNDIYVRGAYNESFIFIFMPIILIGLLNLLNGDIKKFYLNFIIGYIGMINSHLVLSVYFTIPILVYLLVNIKKILIKGRIKHLIMASLVILIFSAPFMILMVQHKNLGIYGVFNSDLVHANSDAVKRFSLSLSDYIIPRVKAYDNTYYFVNIVVLVFFLFGIINLIKNEKNKSIKYNIYGIIMFLLFSVLLSLKYFPYQYLPKLLLSIQFGFRCMSFSIFAISIIAGYGLSFICNNYKKFVLSMAVLFSCIVALFFINKTNFIGISNISWDKYAGMGAQKEYLTKNSLDNINYFDKRDNNIVLLSGPDNVKLDKLKDDAPYLEFNVNNLKKKDSITLELPRLYYLGYKVEIIKENNIKKSIDYKLGKNGFMEIVVKDNGLVKVSYVGTNLYNAFRMIRLLFIISGLIVFISFKRKKKTSII